MSIWVLGTYTHIVRSGLKASARTQCVELPYLSVVYNPTDFQRAITGAQRATFGLGCIRGNSFVCISRDRLSRSDEVPSSKDLETYGNKH